MKTTKSLDSNNYYKSARKYFEKHDYVNAIKNYNLAIKLNPNQAEYYYDLGMTWSAIGNEKRAIRNYTKAIKVNPSDPYAYYARGVSYFLISDYKKAVQDFLDTIELKPIFYISSSSCCHIGIIYSNVGTSENAIEWFEKAITADPNCVNAYLGRGIQYSNLGLFNKAITDFNKSIKISPNYAAAYYCRAVAYAELNNPISIKDIKKAAKLGFMKGRIY